MVEFYVRVDIHARGPGGLSKYSLLVAKTAIVYSNGIVSYLIVVVMK